MTASPGSSSGPGPGERDHAVLVLGIDGGGTKTEAWLARSAAAGEPLAIGRGKAGSSNPRAVGMDAALANLLDAVNDAWRDAGTAAVAADCAVLAISGAGQPEVRDRMAHWAEQRGLAHRVVMEHDAEAVVAELPWPPGSGVGLIVGTGSAAIGAGAGGERFVVGGWGYWFGDEGSAYWLGREALAAVSRSWDHRGPKTALEAAMVKRLEVDQPRAMLGALEKGGDVRRAIAGLAEQVVAVAGAGDAVANDIVDRAAGRLAEMVACAAGGVNLGFAFPLAVAGGAGCGSSLLRERLLAALAARSIAADPVILVPHPVSGCLRLAYRAMAASGG